MIPVKNFNLPPLIENSEGNIRKVGFELEFSGIKLNTAAQVVSDLFNGKIVVVFPGRDYNLSIPNITLIGYIELHHDLEKILQTDILYAEKSHTWLNILLTTRADRENMSKLHQEYGEKKVNLIQFSTWHHRLIGDFAADGFSSGMGYVSNYELDPPRLVVNGKFLRKPGHTWMLGRGSYNPDEVI